MRDIVFLGASALPEVLQLVRDIKAEHEQFRVVAALDDDPSLQGTEIEGTPVTGPLAACAEYPDASFVLTIGSYRSRLLRAEILDRLGLPRARFASLVHPGAKVYETAEVGPGSIIHFGAVIANGSRLGCHNIVLWNSVIGAGNLLGDGVMVTSGVVTNSGAKIGSFAFIGSGSRVAEDVVVGPGAMVAMGSNVFRDVPPGVFQMGEPPRVLSREEVSDKLIQEWASKLAAHDNSPAGTESKN